MPWIYNSTSGAENDIPSPGDVLLLKSGTGWHGPFATQAEATAYYDANKAANPGWKAPTGYAGQVQNLTGDIASPVTKPISSALDTFKGVNLTAWLVRIAEILIGIVLVGVGIAHMSGADNVVSKLVKTSAKGAVLL